MEEFIKWFGFFGTALGIVIGIVGTYFSWNAWNESKKTQQIVKKEEERKNEKIKVALKAGKKEYILPAMRRQDVTRGEILGRLGVIPMKVKGNRYSIEFTNSPEFYKQIDLISAGSNELGNSDLIIDCSNKELGQFNFDQPKIETKKKT
ncbi:MAG TPA: hypothetical protein VGC76_12425 [Pyrinomonadaceae bacterium]|jgi:hypothetical protein